MNRKMYHLLISILGILLGIIISALGSNNDSFTKIQQKILTANKKDQSYSQGQVISAEAAAISGIGTITVGSVTYHIISGKGIGVNSGQTPVISNTGVLSIDKYSGNITLGSGLSIDDAGVLSASVQNDHQNIFQTIAAGNDSFSAGSDADTLTFASGDGISLATDADNKKIMIKNTGFLPSGLTTNGLLYANGSSSFVSLPPGTSGYVLSSNGASSAPSWIAASTLATSSLSFSDITSGTSSASLVVGDGGSLSAIGSGVITATSLLGNTWSSPAAIGVTTPSSAAFSSLTSAGTIRFSDFGAGIVHSDASGVLSASTLNLTTDVSGLLSLANGGTGASSAATARSNLGLGSLAVEGTGTTALTNYVAKSGDSMTGALTINPSSGDGLIVNGTTTDNTNGNIKASNGYVYARGVFDENTTTPGIYMGYGPHNDSPRFLLTNGTPSQNFQIDNRYGHMRFFTPNNTLFELTTYGLIFNKKITTSGNGILNIVPDGTGYTIIGDAGISSHSFNTNDDLFVSGRLEVDGLSYFDNNVRIGGASLCVNATDTACSGNTAGTIYANNTTVQAADVAENYISATQLEPGDLVMPDGASDQTVTKTTDTYQQQVIGVVSTRPGLTLNSDAKTDTKHPYLYPIALSGKVPVKVSTENGDISVGDLLTTSSIPGVAMKATRSGSLIGKALASYAGNSIGKISVFVNLSSNVSSEQFSTPLTGDGVIPQGTTEAVIKQQNITDTSKVFVTSTVITNTPLAVVDKKPGESFTVAIAQPNNKDIHFDWWIAL